MFARAPKPTTSSPPAGEAPQPEQPPPAQASTLPEQYPLAQAAAPPEQPPPALAAPGPPDLPVMAESGTRLNVPLNFEEAFLSGQSFEDETRKLELKLKSQKMEGYWRLAGTNRGFAGSATDAEMPREFNCGLEAKRLGKFQRGFSTAAKTKSRIAKTLGAKLV